MYLFVFMLTQNNVQESKNCLSIDCVGFELPNYERCQTRTKVLIKRSFINGPEIL